MKRSDWEIELTCLILPEYEMGCRKRLRDGADSLALGTLEEQIELDYVDLIT